MFKMETQVVKANPDEIERIKRFFIRMSLIAHCEGDFDVNEHFNPADTDYDFMIQFQKDGVFNYKEFMSVSVNGIGTGFERVINGYEELVEKYCDPESLVLQKPISLFDETITLFMKKYLPINQTIVLDDFIELFERNTAFEISDVRMKVRIQKFISDKPLSVEFFQKNRTEDITCFLVTFKD